MEKLLEFIYGREEVIDTLMSTAEAIQDRNQTRAQIVRSLAELIREDFNLTILDQLTQMINDPFRSLLKFFAEAIHANSVEQISSLNINNLEVDIFLGHDFILKKGVNLLIETSNKIKSQLDQYVANPAHHSSLQNCLDTLISSETSVNELDLFERRVLMRIFKKWHQVIDLEFLKFHEVENPYVAGMPLPAGSPVFVGREEIFRWIQDNLRTKTQKNALVLHGGWHTGKTSILKQLADGPFGERLRKRSNYAIYPVFIDLQELAGRGADIFLFRVAKRISKGLENHGIHIDQPERNDFESKNPYLAFDGILEDIEIQLSKLSDNSLLVIMLDEFELLDDRVREGIIEGDILNYLRSIMQHQPNVTFILAGRHRLDQMTPEFRTRLFNVTLHAKVNLLTKSETEDLICRPVRDYGVTYEDEVIKEILTLTAGHPYFIQQLCYNCISLLNKYCSGYIITHELFEKAIEKAIAENVILPDIWANDLNDDDRSLIRKITLLYNPEISWVSYNDLKYSTEISDEKLSNSLEKLTALQLIEKRISPNSEDNDFRILINLLRLWIEQKQPA
jgi:DNA polymerase III delta prime subunit